MLKHNKYPEVIKLVKSGEAVLLTGERGSGKTTLAKNIAKDLELNFYGMSMTRQTTLSHLLGFMNVNGKYIPSQVRKAVEEGGLLLLDEIDASDPNVILCLNTVENGYVSFPDKIVDIHKDFRLMATSNPQDNHAAYNGRAKLDAATMDRFDEISVELDGNLEKSLVDESTFKHISLIRKCLAEVNSPTYISMRDALRYQKRVELGLLDSYVSKLLAKDLIAKEKYEERKGDIPKTTFLKDCITLDDVWDHITADT